MSVKIIAVGKQLPQYSRNTAEILPHIENWLSGQDERFIRKAKKIFENAGVEKRYSIMDAHEVFGVVVAVCYGPAFFAPGWYQWATAAGGFLVAWAQWDVARYNASRRHSWFTRLATVLCTRFRQP